MKRKILIILSILIIVMAITVGIIWSNFSYLKKLMPAVGFDGPMNYLVLFQNNYEIRPTGGYIGSFATVTVENGGITEMRAFDSNEFDKQSDTKVESPAPLDKFLHIKNWQLRDSNWSPDFPTSARKAVEFYNLESDNNTDFDGVIAINASVLPVIVDFLGSIEVGTHDFNQCNVLFALEYQVEQGFYDQGIEIKDRKQVLFDLIKEVSVRLGNLSSKEKFRLAKIIEQQLENKNIQVYFIDLELENIAKEKQWTGELKKSAGDYLMIVDANLGAFKSDFFVKREIDYLVNFTDIEKPIAHLNINYNHTAHKEGVFVKDYRDFLRVYTKKESWVTAVNGVSNETVFNKTEDHTVFNNFIEVPLNTEKEIKYEYLLSKDNLLENGYYRLLIQKQSGLEKLSLKVTLVFNEGDVQIKKLSPKKNGKILKNSETKQIKIVFEKELIKDEIFEVRIDTNE